MQSTHNLSTRALAASLLFSLAAAQFPPFSLCTEATCDDCPQSVTSGGTGYPNCVVYDSDDVFASADYPSNAGGGYSVYFDIAQPDPTCATIVKSPADTSVEGCGTTIGAFQNAACANLAIKETFMVQFCCGEGDCSAAGVANVKRDEEVSVGSATSSGVFGALLSHANGTNIGPKQNGHIRISSRSPAQKKRASSCVYTADSGMEEYTRPADNTQIVVGNAVNGGTTGNQVQITQSRTQEWSTTISAGVDIFDIVSSSVSFEFSESITDSTAYTFNVPAGQTGEVGFTANLRCTTGTVDQCGDGGSYHGEACTPYSNTDDGIAGTYAVIASS